MAGFIEAVIAERMDISPDFAIIKVIPPTPIGFLPGQFVRLGLMENDRILQRSYTIVSAPHEPFLEFFLELVPQGRLTPMLWELKAGSPLLLHDLAAGIFTLDRKSEARRHLMTASIVGVAPYISMIRAHRHAMASDTAEDIRLALLHNADAPEHFGPYLDELRAAADGDWLTYIPTITAPPDPAQWSGERGRVEDILRKHADTLDFTHANATAYACGHPEMIENVKGILTRAGFAKGQIHTEKYFKKVAGQ